MVLLGMIVGGLRALSHLAHAYCPPDSGQSAVSSPGAGGLCPGITSAVDKVVLKVEDSLSGFGNTTSGLLGYSFIGHELVSDMMAFVFGGNIAPMSATEASDQIAFVNDTSSVHGYTVYGFTDLVLHLVNDVPDNIGAPKVLATTTDIIVAPKYELMLWEAPMCTVCPGEFLTKNLFDAPAPELVVYVPPNTCLLSDLHPLPASTDAMPHALKAPRRLGYLGTMLLRLLRLSGALGTPKVSLTVGATAHLSGYGLYLLVVGAMLWSTLTTSWYNIGIGCGVPLAVLEGARIGLNFYLPRKPTIHLASQTPVSTNSNPSSNSNADSDSEDLSALSDEDLAREIAELMRAMDENDARMDAFGSGIARLDGGMDALDSRLARLDALDAGFARLEEEIGHGQGMEGEGEEG
ncbi:uncharacterized protein C8Q71DRAFT_764515 [Rhodofomes roseus]|uniref:Uncharacterized protein n=1 Tax=Rhodofomes roseus TaxID=34475 RepID=A0ABQ8KD38_9APHY|nr:uncharacterized protein C8Q71DRAFT_908363 [Rhodofomes roseus]XP_047777612.1 uncharacterized protein C8Q71DRAFT_764515 [Rhodofomes roseus]KAH9835172.1 hypothetical protein C8Q71DRAFT_908363 [Rhodofomes roseus]KAH9835179.1 hypothetical protein C8Q71DRAFT_764515 [Rhodofomes roseus]